MHLLLALALVLLAACDSRSEHPAPVSPGTLNQQARVWKPVPGREYSAVIRRTSHGIPHVLAHDYVGLGYGYGYAFAQDNLCELAELLVTVNAERSRYFGPDATYSTVTGGTIPNLKSDFFYQSINSAGTVERLLSLAPPLGPSREMRALVRGYVAGYNRYLRDTGVDALPDPRCRGRAWVRPITELELFRRYYQLSLLASAGFFVNGLVNARPPSLLPGGMPLPSSTSTPVIDPSVFPSPENLRIGSNAYGLGRDATRNGRGMVLANPHFPWEGSERFYQVHLTLPGELDVSGASLLGVPVVIIGHNARLAWSHTVSTAHRFTPYELKLVPGNPTTYLHEEKAHPMTRQTVTVLARKADGTLEPRSHTFYRTRFGPILEHPQGLMSWGTATAYAFRDVNASNLRMMDQFLAMNRARTLAELRQAQDTWQGIPWVNTVAADAEGNTYYADASVIPHVTDEKISRCVVSSLARAIYQLSRLPVLDGTRAECDWGSDPDAVAPGIFGPSRLPRLLRSDYVANSNDSHWLSNPRQPLTGYPTIIGAERTARGLRTRLGIQMVEQRLAGTDGMEGRGFTLEQLQAVVFSNRNLSGELLRDAAVAMCRRTPLVPLPDGRSVDVSEACPILERWNLRGDLDSTGAALWREFNRRAQAVAGGPYLVPFNAEDPVNTPHTLDVAHPQVLQSLGSAVQYLRDQGIALEAPLGSLQGTYRPGVFIPLHGCIQSEGCFNVLVAQMQAEGTYSRVVSGSTFVMAVSFTDAGPVARSVLASSQSSNPASPFFADQTYLYSAKQWVDMRFTDEEIASDPGLSVTFIHE